MQSGPPSKIKVVNSALTTYGEELGDPTTPRKTSTPLICRVLRCRGFHPDSIEYLYWNAFMLLPLLFTGTVMPYRLAFRDFRISDGEPPPPDDLFLDVIV